MIGAIRCNNEKFSGEYADGHEWSEQTNGVSNKAKPIDENIPYCEAMGSLLYKANVSCPDICYAVNLPSRRQNCTMYRNWFIVKKFLDI